MRSITHLRVPNGVFVAVSSPNGATALVVEMARELAVTPETIVEAIYTRMEARIAQGTDAPPLTDGEALVLEACAGRVNIEAVKRRTATVALAAMYARVFARAEATRTLPRLVGTDAAVLKQAENAGVDIDAVFGEASAAYYAHHSRPAAFVA